MGLYPGCRALDAGHGHRGTVLLRHGTRTSTYRGRTGDSAGFVDRFGADIGQGTAVVCDLVSHLYPGTAVHGRLPAHLRGVFLALVVPGCSRSASHAAVRIRQHLRSEEHTSELQSP